jgi:ubiquinone/menaquinone biosynthesis C-methylase UbiE
MAAHVDRWLRTRAQSFLRRTGIRNGRCVLDFGCWEGRYTIPAARIVGDEGLVYAVDKDRAALRVMKRKAKKEGLRNIEAIHVPAGKSVPVPAQVADFALLYDVLHGGYLPEKPDRKSVLREIHRTLKRGGRLSCYLTHVKEFRLTFGELLAEIESTGFRLLGESRRTLVHSDKVVRGRVFSFEKRSGSRQVRHRRPKGDEI